MERTVPASVVLGILAHGEKLTLDELVKRVCAASPGTSEPVVKGSILPLVTSGRVRLWPDRRLSIGPQAPCPDAACPECGHAPHDPGECRGRDDDASHGSSRACRCDAEGCGLCGTPLFAGLSAFLRERASGAVHTPERCRAAKLAEPEPDPEPAEGAEVPASGLAEALRVVRCSDDRMTNWLELPDGTRLDLAPMSDLVGAKAQWADAVWAVQCLTGLP